jgi:hypothetical protein
MEVDEMGRIVSLILVSLITAGAATAADSDLQRETLRGLKGVQVLVEGLSPEFKDADLEATMVQNDVELKLRQAGIKVVTKTESSATPGMPTLCISAEVWHPPTGDYVYDVRVELQQPARLEREPKIIADGARTWRSGGAIGTSGIAMLNTSVRDAVADKVDEFIKAYLSVNPK